MVRWLTGERRRSRSESRWSVDTGATTGADRTARFCATPPKTVVDNLRTSRDGRTETEAAARLEEHGYNRFRDRQRTGRL
ncbi:cation-transporting P-type ATPase [Haloarchaeobius sp. HRN-SO-5]|uniref:cation-transporting P-type ATPase n=1 Tax=Haloarchaeobius sp. HRN-SO-5 TaxID=3446118 RepID=UPI003EBF8300